MGRWFGYRPGYVDLCRLYLTPDLEQSGAYGYEIRARWKQDGKPIERTRKVIVHPGNRVTVDFLGLEGKE